jgi:glutathione S-transferase
MRARLAIKACGIQVILREVVLRNKPQQMLDISPKATVPVLQLSNGNIIDESWDIVQWAISTADPKNLAPNAATVQHANALVQQNDNDFKQHLDHYKYADRFPEHPAEHYRSLAEVFLQHLENLLSEHRYLLGELSSIADIGIFPFVRQFAHVDIDWFRQTPYPKLHAWMDEYLASELFSSVMQKYPAWTPDSETLIF